MPRGDDEHMNVPTWRMRQLQDIEHAAREAVEALTTMMRAEGNPVLSAQLVVVWDLLREALGDDG